MTRLAEAKEAWYRREDAKITRCGVCDGWSYNNATCRRCRRGLPDSDVRAAVLMILQDLAITASMRDGTPPLEWDAWARLHDSYIVRCQRCPAWLYDPHYPVCKKCRTAHHRNPRARTAA